MGFKAKPIKYNSGEGIAKIKLEDDTGRNIENWVIMMSDLGSWYETMKKKYGDRVDLKKKRDQDLDWLR